MTRGVLCEPGTDLGVAVGGARCANAVGTCCGVRGCAGAASVEA